MIDLDVVAVGELSTKIEKIIDSNNAIFVNDITDNVIPAYGKEKNSKKNLDLVLGERSKTGGMEAIFFLATQNSLKNYLTV